MATASHKPKPESEISFGVSVITPCKNCEDRHMGCHSECERYAKYKQECELENQARRERLQLTSAYIDSCTRKNINRFRKTRKDKRK